MTESTITLKDGRQLGYGMYGNEQGIPIIDFHGIPGSRCEAELFEKFINRKDICFIGIDRPGYGRSSQKRHFQINDFPSDVVALVDHLKIERFFALGYSGGGPFALACAHQIPERIAAISIVSGVGPAGIGSEGMHESNRKKFDMAQQLPWLARFLLQSAFSSLRNNPEKLAAQLKEIWQQMPEPDIKALQDPLFADGIVGVTKDAITNGVVGWANEEVLMTQPWHFNLHEIHCANIFLWHGALDRNVPEAMAKAVSGQIPHCRSTFLPDEGHLSILYNHGNKIIDQLTRCVT
jgi:pimeloyl-ACP methyl ester carboxylesterase